MMNQTTLLNVIIFLCLYLQSLHIWSITLSALLSLLHPTQNDLLYLDLDPIHIKDKIKQLIAKMTETLLSRFALGQILTETLLSRFALGQILTETLR